MPSQTSSASDRLSFPHLLKFTTLREIGGADGSGEGEGDNFQSNLFCNGSKLSSKRKKKKKEEEAISLQYTSIVQTEVALLEASRNSADSRSQQRSSELIIYEVPPPSLF